MVPHAPESLEEMVPFADLVGRHELADRLWLGQAVRIDPHNLFSALALSGRAVPTGTAVTLAPLRHPYEAALQARSVSALTGHSHVAGYGAGSPRFVAALHGQPYPKPLRAMNSYLRIVAALLRDEAVQVDSPDFVMNGRLAPAEADSDVEVGAGMLRAGMARAAGRHAGCGITWLTPPSHIEAVLTPALTEQAEKSGRARPRIVSVVHVMTPRADSDPVHRVLNASGMHLGMQHYVSMLSESGLACSVEDPVRSAAELITGGVYCYGEPDEIVEQLRAWERVGVDEVVLNAGGTFFSHGLDDTALELRAVLEAAQVLR